jgi:methionyl-tRNA formyltransferase
VVIAFGQKIGPEIIALPPKGAINVHASLLPKYRGAAPINWALVNGETRTGISIITLADKIDAGDILNQSATEIGPHETAGELHDRLAQLAGPTLLDALAQLEAGTATYTRQEDAEATYAPKLRKADGALNFSEPAAVLSRKVRGFWPWPGACARYVSQDSRRSVRVTLARADVIWGSNPPGSVPGTFDEDLNLLCGEGKLSIMRLKPASSHLMEFRDFINGWHVQPGDRLTKVE